MKLFSMPGTCALSVHIVLEWIGAPFDVEVMNRGDNRTPAYLAINPSGQVPALRLDDGTILTEAAAILPFLAESFPEAGLDSDDSALGRYRLAQLLSFLTGEVHVAFKPFFMPQRFLADEAQFAALKANPLSCSRHCWRRWRRGWIRTHSFSRTGGRSLTLISTSCCVGSRMHQAV